VWRILSSPYSWGNLKRWAAAIVKALDIGKEPEERKTFVRCVMVRESKQLL